MSKYFLPRIWLAVGFAVLILAVALTLMLGGGWLWGSGSYASANGLVGHLVTSNSGDNGGSYRLSAFLEEGTSQRTATTTTLASSSTSIVNEDSVTFTASVKPASGTGTPTGTVTFLDDTTKLDSATLNGSGVATFTTTALPIGTHAITAAYSGDHNFAASTSDVVAVSVSGMGGLPASVIIR